MSSSRPVSTGKGWQNAPAFEKLTASQQGGNRGAQLWGVQYNGTLDTIYQITPGGSWSQWLGPDWAVPVIRSRCMNSRPPSKTMAALSSLPSINICNSGLPAKPRQAAIGRHGSGPTGTMRRRR
jgi:hypothetical protein